LKNRRVILAGIGFPAGDENEAKTAKLGIWNRRRELFRNASNSSVENDNDVMGGNSRMIDQLDEDESLRL